MCFRKHRKDAGSCCENSCENCQCFGVWLSQLQLLRYLILHRIFKKETVTMSRNLRSESGGETYFQGNVVFGILLLQNLVKTERTEGRKRK